MNLYFGNAKTIAKSGSALYPKLQVTKDAELNRPSDWLPAHVEVPLLTVHFTRLAPGNVAEGEGSIGYESRGDSPTNLTLSIRRDPSIKVASHTLSIDNQQKKLTSVTGSEWLEDGAALAVYRLYASTTVPNTVRLLGPVHFTIIIRL
ncbi:hypothetical protein A374_07744 [Fictibacillus macauensis ZFHKF-1]|uniref:Uncharacterized protein n=1 Tax=Fictibacillus macauensis ZFHKF-1 TaxID=1196324 RepID=I8UFN8_9BACL|nr:hypothetical protein [Fictibacillus macauensis]EIT85710.1 hypothetical protein A374_07744 [Fictibacillus macauensis ZFHKF-1]